MSVQQNLEKLDKRSDKRPDKRSDKRPDKSVNYKKPIFPLAKFPKFGNTTFISVLDTPNQVANVPAS
jgi:hypothetical protein